MLGNIERAITGFLQQNNNPLGLLLLAAAAMLEYVFPPFPGDTVTLFGAFLVTRHGWSLPFVFISVLVGSGAGCMLTYAVGMWLRKPYHAGRVLRRAGTRRAVERVLVAFQRHGAAYVAINRFLPAMRAVFFLAAGMAGLHPFQVLVFALLSAAAWNVLILGAGYLVGSNWDDVRRIFAIYTKAAWAALAGTGALLLVRWLWQRRRRPKE